MNKSSELILRALANGSTTQKELIRATALAPRTVRYVISELKKQGILEEVVLLDDLRIKTYKLKEEWRSFCRECYLNMDYVKL